MQTPNYLSPCGAKIPITALNLCRNKNQCQRICFTKKEEEEEEKEQKVPVKTIDISIMKNLTSGLNSQILNNQGSFQTRRNVHRLCSSSSSSSSHSTLISPVIEPFAHPSPQFSNSSLHSPTTHTSQYQNFTTMFQRFRDIQNKIIETRNEIREARDKERRAFVDFDLFKIQYGEKCANLIRDCQNMVDDRRIGWVSMSKTMTSLAKKRKEKLDLERVKRERVKKEEEIQKSKFEAYRFRQEAKEKDKKAYKIMKVLKKEIKSPNKDKVYEWLKKHKAS